MSIITEPAPLSFPGDDSTVDSPINWKYFKKSDVVATLRDSSGTETVWVLDTDYTLTDAGVDAGGTLTATTAHATGETLVVTLEPDNVQASSLPIGGLFPSVVVEKELDIAAQRDSKIEEVLNRALRVPKTDVQSGSGLELPIDTVRASNFLACDSNGKIIAAAGTSANLGPVSTYIDTLLPAADEETARATLGTEYDNAGHILAQRMFS